MNKRIQSRVNRIIVLCIMILAGMTWSRMAEAQKPPRSKVSKAMVRSSRQSNANKACYLLHKKRMARTPATASVRRPKPKPLAETDSGSSSY